MTKLENGKLTNYCSSMPYTFRVHDDNTLVVTNKKTNTEWRFKLE